MTVCWVLSDDDWQRRRGMRTCVGIRPEWLAAYRTRIIERGGGRIVAVYRLRAK